MPKIHHIRKGRHGDPDYPFYDKEELLVEYYARCDAERNPDLSFREWLFLSGTRGADAPKQLAREVVNERAVQDLRESPELLALLGL